MPFRSARRGAVLALAFLALAPCARAQSAPPASQAARLPAPVAQPAPLLQAEPPVYAVGEKWTYKYENALDPAKNSTYTQTVTHVDASRVEINDGATILDASSNVVKIGPASYEPSDGKLRFPLRVGDSWPASYVYRSGSWEASGQRKVQVVSVERVDTPAGSFDTFRIEQTVSWAASGGNRGQGVTRETDWYAPEVGRIVKLEYVDQPTHGAPSTTSVVLVGFSRPQ
jgi:hypothetical protein